MTKKKSTSNHYVDNKKFLEALTEYRNKVLEAEASGDPRPRVTEYIGSCFLLIAQRLSYRPNFMNYTYKDDMISDGIENALAYIDNFNPEKSNNPFDKAILAKKILKDAFPFIKKKEKATGVFSYLN